MQKSVLALLFTLLMAGCNSSDKRPVGTKPSETPQPQEVTPATHETAPASTGLAALPDPSTVKECGQLMEYLPSTSPETLKAVWTTAEIIEKTFPKGPLTLAEFKCGTVKIIVQKQPITVLKKNEYRPSPRFLDGHERQNVWATSRHTSISE
jgi:hypothetical protein